MISFPLSKFNEGLLKWYNVWYTWIIHLQISSSKVENSSIYIYFYELQDILFFVNYKTLKTTWTSLHLLPFRTLLALQELISFHIIYVIQLPLIISILTDLFVYGTPYQLVLLTSLYYTLQSKIPLKFFWNHFVQNLNSNNPCPFHVMCPLSKCSRQFQ